MSESTKSARARKAADRPKKPYPDFPLTPHASGAWQKKIRGKVHYFWKWAHRVNGRLERLPGDGLPLALELYDAQRDDLHAGRTPRARVVDGKVTVSDADGLTVAALCNHFLTAKTRAVEAGELGPRMFVEYRETTDLIVGAFGANRLVDDLAAGDFGALRATMARRWGPVRLGNAITRVKSVFKFGTENGLVERAVRYGSEFKKPGKAVLRRHRAKALPKMVEADELRRLVDAADPAMRAMILLGLNCGFGNHDCATLPLSAVSLDAGWIDFPRPKTGIARRCPLWPETVAALRAVVASRPTPKGYAECGIVFLNSRGSPWVKVTAKSRTDNVSVHFANLLQAHGLHRDGLGFYALRHVHRTVADGARDPVACDVIMGHADGSMAGHYRERIDDSRLVAVTDHVRRWLFPDAQNPAQSTFTPAAPKA
jgi:integrase